MSADARSSDAGAIQYRVNTVGDHGFACCAPLCLINETWRYFFCGCEEETRNAAGDLKRK